MVKKLTFILLIVLVALGGWICWNIYKVFFSKNIYTQSPSFISGTPTTPSSVLTKSILLEDEQLSYNLFTASPSSVVLLPNFAQKETSAALLQTNGCKQAINGGFYDKQNHPLGLFMVDGDTLGEEIQSALFNGFLVIGNSGTATIADGYTRNSSDRITLQSGPILMNQGNILPLRIQNDEHARRMVVAQTTQGTLVFLSVYDQESVFEGPLLARLPAAIRAIATKENLSLTDALNLDGGSASAFYNNSGTSLSEFTPVGSLFCIQ